jgi:hypothetical protein
LYHYIACCSWLSCALFLLWYRYCLFKLCHTCSNWQFLPEHEWLQLHYSVIRNRV